MEMFFKVWRIIGFMLVSIIMWPFLMPWVLIKRGYRIQRILMDTELGRKKWYRFIMCGIGAILYIPSLIYELTVGYGKWAYYYYTHDLHNLNDLLEDIDKNIDELVKDDLWKVD